MKNKQKAQKIKCYNGQVQYECYCNFLHDTKEEALKCKCNEV